MAEDIGEFGEFSDLVPKKRSAGDRAKDIGKAALGGAVQAVGYGVRGIGEGLQSATGRVSRAIDAPPPSENLLIGLGRAIEGGGEAINESISEEGRRLMRESTPSESARLLEPSTWDLGEAPSIEGYALQASNVLGQAAPVIGSALATRGKMVPTAGVAAATGGGGAASQEEQRIAKMSQMQLDSVPGYQDRIAAGMSPEAARADLSRAAAEEAFLSTAPVSALSAFTEGLPITQAGQRALSSIAGTGRLARMGVGATGAFVGEGVQEAVENAATIGGANIATGENRDIGEGSFQNFLLGGIGAAPIGAVGGLRGIDEAPQGAAEPDITTYGLQSQDEVQQDAQENQQGSDQKDREVEYQQARSEGLRWAQVGQDIAGPGGPIVNAMRQGASAISGNPVVDAFLKQQRDRDALAAAEGPALANMTPAQRAFLFQVEQQRAAQRQEQELAAARQLQEEADRRAAEIQRQALDAEVAAETARTERRRSVRDVTEDIAAAAPRPIFGLPAPEKRPESRQDAAEAQPIRGLPAPQGLAAPEPRALPAPGSESGPPRGGPGGSIVTDRAGRAITAQDAELLGGRIPAFRADTPEADAHRRAMEQLLGYRKPGEQSPFDTDEIRSRSGNTFKSLKAAEAQARRNPGYVPFETRPREWVLRRDPNAKDQSGILPQPPPQIMARSGKPFGTAAAAKSALRSNPGYEVARVDGGWALRRPAAAEAVDRGTNVSQPISVTPAQINQINKLSADDQPIVAENGAISLDNDRLRMTSAAIRDEFDGKTTAHARSMLELADRMDAQVSGEPAPAAQPDSGETSMKSMSDSGTRFTSSAGRTSASVKVDAVKSLVRNVTKSWGQEINVMPTARDFPAEVVAHAGFNDNVDAVIHRGKIYIAANRMRSVRQVMQTLAHEAVGHAGIENMLGAKAFNEVVDSVRKLRDSGKMAEIFKQVDKEYDGASERTKLREAIAHMAERGEKSTIIQRLIGAIRSFIRNRLGIKLDFSEGDLRRMLIDAARFVENGGNASTSKDTNFRKGDSDGKEKPGNKGSNSGGKGKAGGKRSGRVEAENAQEKRQEGAPGERYVPPHDAPSFAQNKPRKGSSRVLGVHYSSEKGLKSLDGTFAGSGSAGGERRRFGPGQYGKQGGTASRLYFYVQTGDSLPAKEDVVVGANAYRVQLDNVYDVSRDPLGIVEQVREENGGVENADLLEETLSELGYDGFVTDPVGGGITESVAVLFDLKKKVPVKPVKPTGETSFKKQTETPEFKRWFGASKAVDDDGNPLIVYHGTNREFNEFSIAAGPRSRSVGDMDGVHFTNDRAQAQAIANSLARSDGGTARVVEAYIKAENPAPFGKYRTRDAAIAAGHDSRLTENNAGLQEWTVFNPSQIKSATGNTGSFDPDNDNILFKKQTDTPEFKRWFGGSKVVDSGGAPLVVYHGTSKDSDFSTFKAPKNGIWFTSDPKSASDYAKENDSKSIKFDGRAYTEVNTKSRVMPVFLRIKNPKVYSEWPDKVRNASNYRRAQADLFAELQRQGHDGVHAGDVWVAFDRGQIKSAIGNTGAFDPDNANISFKKSSEPMQVTEHSTPLQAATAAWQHIANADRAFRISLPEGEKDFAALAKAASPLARATPGSQIAQELYDAEAALMRAEVRFDEVEGNYYVGRNMVGSKDDVESIYLESRDQLNAIGRHANVINRFPALTEKPNTTPEDIEWAVRMGDGETAYIMRTGKPNEFYAYNPYLRRKGAGTPFYQAFFAWAANNGYVAAPDPDGLTPINSYRRTEQMLASALRFGTTSHLRPAMVQGVRQWLRKPATDADHAFNIMNLIEALNSSYNKAIPELSKYEFNFDSGKIERDGAVVSSDELEALAKSKKARDIGLGRSTIERAIITNTVIKQGSPAVAKVAAATAAGVTPNEYAEILYKKSSDNDALLRNAAMTREGSASAYGGVGRAAARLPSFGSIKESLGNKAADTRSAWLKALTRQQIVDVGRDQFNVADGNLATGFERLARKMEADAQLELDRPIRDGGRSVSKIAEDWSKSMLPDSLGGNRRMGGEMASLMYDTTLAGIDPSRQYKDGDNRAQYNALRARYSALSPEHQALYRDVRDAYSKRRRDFYEALKERIQRAEVDDRAKVAMLDKLRIAMEAGRVKGPYFPLSRFGDYYVVAEGGPSGGPDRQFVMAETQKEQKAEAARLRALGYTVRTGKSMKGLASELGPSAGFVGDLAKLIDAQHDDGEIDAGAADALKDGLYQMYLQTLPEQSVRKHFIHRKGTAGFSRDALRAFAHQMGHGSKQLSRVRFSDKLSGTLRSMRKHADSAPDPNKAADIVKALNDSYQWMMNPTNATWAQKATSLGFLWYLGVSPAAALVNVSQVPIITYPVLASKYGWGKAAAALTSGTKDYVAASLNPAKRKTLEAEYAGDMGKMLDELEHSGAIDRTMTMSLMGLSDEKSTTKVGENRVMRIVGSLFHKAERLNREATAIATYRLARNAGSSHADAVDAAYESIFESHFDYSAANRAKVFQGNMARVLLLFKQYSQNITYFLARNAWNSLKGESKEVRRQAATKLAGVLGMTGLFAGVTGLPGFGMAATMASLMHAMFGDDDEPYNPEAEFRKWLADNFGSAAPLIAKGAVNEATGLDIAGRTGMGELWVRSPDRELEGNDLAYHYLEQVAGPAVAIALQAPKAMKLLEDGHTERAVEAMSPKFLKDWMKAARFNAEGVQSLRGDPIMKDVSAWNVINQAAGFTPSELSEQYDKNNALKNAERHVLDRRQSLVNMWAMARLQSDAEGVAEAKVLIDKFNRRWPNARITQKTLTDSIRKRREVSRKALNGISLNPKLREELIENYGF